MGTVEQLKTRLPIHLELIEQVYEARDFCLDHQALRRAEVKDIWAEHFEWSHDFYIKMQFILDMLRMSYTKEIDDICWHSLAEIMPFFKDEVPMGANAATWLKHEEPKRTIVSIIYAVLGKFGVGNLSAEGLQKVYLTKKSQYEPIFKDRMFFFRSIPAELKLGGSKQQVNALSEEASEIYTLLCEEFIQTEC